MAFCVRCGAVNDDAATHCALCGHVLPQAPGSPQAASRQLRAPRVIAAKPASSGSSTPPVAVIAAIALGAVAVLALCAWLFVISPSMARSSASTQAAGSAEAGTRQVTSGLVEELGCSLSTTIVPLRSNGSPFDAYRVELNPLNAPNSSKAVFPDLSVKGTAGFSLADFNGASASGVQSRVTDGSYELVMTDSGTGHVCKVRVSYSSTNANTCKRIEVRAV